MEAGSQDIVYLFIYQYTCKHCQNLYTFSVSLVLSCSMTSLKPQPLERERLVPIVVR